jgi:antirestriction protein
MYLDESIKRIDEVILHQGSLADYAFELVEDICSLDQLPDLIRNHIDYESIGRDLELNSEVAEIHHNLWVVNCYEF